MFTVKNRLFGKAPARIELLGDKTKRPESATHIIEFPGGAVEVSRTSDGNYWAHIIVHRGQIIEDCEGRMSAQGVLVDSRIGRSYPCGVEPIERADDIEQIAVLIRPFKSPR